MTRYDDMNAITIEAHVREAGKRAAKAARRAERVPAVIYGFGVEPVSISVPELSLRPLIYTTEFHTVQITADGQTWDCIMKDVTYHPVTDRPTHVDFQVLVPGREVAVTVPVKFIGTPKGQIAGGRTRKVLRKLNISALPENLPTTVDVEIAELEIGQTIQVQDLPSDGITFTDMPDQTIVAIARPRGGMAAAEGEGEDAEADA